jgi:hypothetical protein
MESLCRAAERFTLLSPDGRSNQPSDGDDWSGCVGPWGQPFTYDLFVALRPSEFEGRDLLGSDS